MLPGVKQCPEILHRNEPIASFVRQVADNTRYRVPAFLPRDLKFCGSSMHRLNDNGNIFESIREFASGKWVHMETTNNF